MGRIRHALIMAAGRGMRMAPLTDALPKPMAPYDGSTLIARGIDTIKPHIEHVHITVGYKGAVLARHVIEHGVSSVFNTEGRPNSWWIYNTLMKWLDEPVYVLTCDNVMALDFELLEQNYFDLGAPANMIVPVRVIEGHDGDYIHHEGNRVTALGRDLRSDIYCSGIQILNPRRINELTREGASFYDTWRQLIDRRLLYLSDIYPKSWRAVDTLQQLAELNRQRSG